MHHLPENPLSSLVRPIAGAGLGVSCNTPFTGLKLAIPVRGRNCTAVVESNGASFRCVYHA